MIKFLRFTGIILYILVNYIITAYFLHITAPYAGLVILSIWGLFVFSGLLISLVFHRTSFKKNISIHLIFQATLNIVAALIALYSYSHSMHSKIREILFYLISGLVISAFGVGMGRGLFALAKRAVGKFTTK